jgi:hypothetical protein
MPKRKRNKETGDADKENRSPVNPVRLNTATPPRDCLPFRFFPTNPIVATIPNDPKSIPLTPLTQYTLAKEIKGPLTRQRSIQWGVRGGDGEISTPSKSSPLIFICSLGTVNIYRKSDTQDIGKASLQIRSSQASLTEEEKFKILTSLAPSDSGEKKQTHKFSYKDIHNIASKRIPTQSKVIAPYSNCSANKLAELCQQNTLIKWEYGHLIAHRFLGDKAQKADNLVVMTEYCNSLMLLLEDEISRLSEKISGAIQLTVNAQPEEDPLKKQCHFAKLITYQIECEEPKIDFKITFDPYLSHKPPKNISGIMRAIFDANINRNLLKQEIESFFSAEENFEFKIPIFEPKKLEAAFNAVDNESAPLSPRF